MYKHDMCGEDRCVNRTCLERKRTCVQRDRLLALLMLLLLLGGENVLYVPVPACTFSSACTFFCACSGQMRPETELYIQTKM
jgi:hypothetical protein